MTSTGSTRPRMDSGATAGVGALPNGGSPQISASPSGHHKKHFSIDLSLELERQLELESAPSTPAHDAQNHVSKQQHAQGAPSTGSAHEMLDPHVLASIVMQLRQSLADMTRERDDLLALLAKANESEAELRDALQAITDKATGMEDELSQARRKIRDDDEAISMLRTKVEESRRGLMRLQTENRRQSIQSIQSLDMSRAGVPSFHAPTSSRDKRASFTPLTGSFNLNSGSQTVTMPDAGSSPAAKSNRRISGFFTGGNIKTLENENPDGAELLKLRREVDSLKDTLEETRHELSEMAEARDASETCVNALREFIAENNVGVARAEGPTSTQAPLPPSNSDESTKTSGSGSGGWGFNKLWKVDTSVPAVSSAPSGASPSSAAAATPTPTNTTVGKFSRFFSRGTSVSSIGAVTEEKENNSVKSSTSADSGGGLDTSPARSNPPAMSYRTSSSDVSSLVEPLSPTEDSPSRANNILVRDGSETGISQGSPGDLKPLPTPEVGLPLDVVVQ